MALGSLGATIAAALVAGCTGCLAAPYHDGAEWRGYEELALALGKMRLERAPTGLPVSRQSLAQNFRRIAFGLEADVLGRGGQQDAIETTEGGVLRRWERPVRWSVTSLGPRAREHMEAVRTMTGRLARATGHDISEADPGGETNLAILFLRPEDYGPAANAVRTKPAGRWLAAQIDRFGRSGRAPCIGIFLHSKGEAAITGEEIVFGLALIRDGLPPRLAKACVEEELAQTMGLPNDDPYVRPSVFNDDQEFALLTRHDEALLAILYDGRLVSGMSESEAMELVPMIVDEFDLDELNGRAER